MAKTNFAKLFTLRADGRYQGYWKDRDGGRHALCDRDPEKLYARIVEKETPPPLTFGVIADAWETQVFEKLKPGTQACYSKPLRRAVDSFGSRPAAELSAPEIYSLLARLAAQAYSVKTVKMQLTVIRQIYKHALIDPVYGEELRYNPADTVTIPREAKKAVHRTAPEDEIVALIRARASTAYFGLFALFLLSTGFRRGEALAVRWRDIDLKGKTVACTGSVGFRSGKAEVGSTKTVSGIRTVPLLPDLERALRQLPAHRQTDFLFHGEDPAAPLPEVTFRRRWKHYCKDMGFVETSEEQRTSAQGRRYVYTDYKPTLTPHVLRHGYATLLYEAGVDMYTAQRLLGHADIQTTMTVYTHLRERQEQASVGKLIAHVQTALDASVPLKKEAV